jgi:UDP-N-acetylglucosamine 2-epimerase (non-hydrolysing)
LEIDKNENSINSWRETELHQVRTPVKGTKKRLSRSYYLIHTGQHYDYEMNKVFFDELRIPEPDYHLGVGSGTHGEQTGELLKRIEEVLLEQKPELVLVFGDTNTTLVGALAASKLHITLGHIEAGLRSFDKKMPEETNRVLTDHSSDLLFCPTETAVENLKKKIVNKSKWRNGAHIEDTGRRYGMDF